MLLMPYDTTQGRMYQVDKIVTEIKRAQIEAPLPEVETPAGNVLKNICLITPNDAYEDVKQFTQFVNMGTDQEPKLVIDGRQFTKWDRRTDTYRLTASNDWMFQCVRLALTARCLKDGPGEIRRFGDIPALTFIKWITRAVVPKYSLDEATELKVMVVCAFYYYGMIDPDIATDKDARAELVNVVYRLTKVSHRSILEISDGIKSLKTFDDLAKTIANDIGTIRLGDIKGADILVLIQGSFFGIYSREHVGVAVEHLPTFIAMVYTCIQDRSYKRYTLATRALSSGTQKEQKDFLDAVYRQVAGVFK